MGDGKSGSSCSLPHPLLFWRLTQDVLQANLCLKQNFEGSNVVCPNLIPREVECEELHWTDSFYADMKKNVPALSESSFNFLLSEAQAEGHLVFILPGMIRSIIMHLLCICMLLPTRRKSDSVIMVAKGFSCRHIYA